MTAEQVGEMLASHLFVYLHNLLVKQTDENGLVNIGLGFPEYDLDAQTVGRTISLFGNEKDLDKLDLPDSIPGIKEFVVLNGPYPVEEPKVYHAFRKVRFKHSPGNKIRRAMKRHGYTYKEAEELYERYSGENRGARVAGLPCVQFFSRSTQRMFPIHIEKVAVEKPLVLAM